MAKQMEISEVIANAVAEAMRIMIQTMVKMQSRMAENQ